MMDMRKYEFSQSDGQEIVEFARDALETYVREGQRMDVGSVNDLLNMRGGMLLQLQSSTGMKRLRGSAASYQGFRIAESVIRSTVYAASSRSIGSEISYTETQSVVFKISMIERVVATENPGEYVEVGRDVPIIIGSNVGWVFPTQAVEYGWDAEELLTRTCKKANVKPDLWKDENMVILKTRTFTEEELGGRVEAFN